MRLKLKDPQARTESASAYCVIVVANISHVNQQGPTCRYWNNDKRHPKRKQDRPSPISSMPKKRKPNYTPKPQNAPHPSLQRTTQHAQNTTSQPTQVNDLLLHLRKVQSKSQHSSEPVLPPAPSVSYPLPQPAELSQPLTPLGRMRARARARRLPGPPAPPSWTKTKSRLQLEEDAVKQSKRMDRLPELTLPAPGSLRFMCLRKLAVDWERSIYRDNGHWLSLVPQHLKQALLAFLVIYGPKLVPLQELELLFVDDIEGTPGSGAEQITHVHFGYASNPVTGYTRGYKDLARFLFGSEYLKSVKTPNQDLPGIPDSWDEETLTLTPSLRPRFSGLTHLSLAHASHTSWKALLRDLTPHLKQLTHLSLAYWPQPCLLPNSRTATIRGPAGEINVSATGFYNRLDNDWGEAAGIIQQLGKDLICLKWLDLEGCSRDGWIEALQYQGWRKINWAQTFRGLVTLVVGQGELPSQLTYESREDFIREWATWALGLFGKQARSSDALFARDGWLTQLYNFVTVMRTKGIDVTALDVQRIYLWLENEHRIGIIANHINGMRRVNGIVHLNVQGTSYPPWVRTLVDSPQRGSETTEIGYEMLRKIGLSGEELQMCSTNLRDWFFKKI